MPDNKQEDERIKEIASKLSSHIQVAFDEFDNMDEVIDYLTPTFQREKLIKHMDVHYYLWKKIH
ncbi:hypothetical protein ABLV89_14095 [Staphylococcus equorum]